MENFTKKVAFAQRINNHPDWSRFFSIVHLLWIALHGMNIFY